MVYSVTINVELLPGDKPLDGHTLNLNYISLDPILKWCGTGVKHFNDYGSNYKHNLYFVPPARQFFTKLI